MLSGTLNISESPSATKLQTWQLRRLSKLPTGDRCVCLPVLSVEEIWNNDLDEKCYLPDSLKTMSSFHSQTMHRVSLSSSVSSRGRETPSKVKKNQRGVEACHDISSCLAMTGELSRVTSGRQCTNSQDKWKNFTDKNELKEVSREFHELASTLEEESHTWNKICKDSVKREGDIPKLAELAAQDEKQEDEERRDMKELFKQFRIYRKDEDEAKAILKEMQINLRGLWSAKFTSPWTKYGRCCRATTQRPSI